MFDSKAMSKPSEPSETPDLDQRLGLYRVFLKLYEHHRELLDEILDLEYSENRHRIRSSWQFVQGVIQKNQVCLITNLLHDRTEVLIQPQNGWIIGRDRNVSIPFLDKRLSRRHALVQYVTDQGFYLQDLNSTNGSYVNGEPVRRPVLLKDGDLIRLGSLSFIFFLCQKVRRVEAIPAEIWEQFDISQPMAADPRTIESINPIHEKIDELGDIPLAGSDRETFAFLDSSNPLAHEHHGSVLPELSSAQKAEILDRFLNR